MGLDIHKQRFNSAIMDEQGRNLDEMAKWAFLASDASVWTTVTWSTCVRLRRAKLIGRVCRGNSQIR